MMGKRNRRMLKILLSVGLATIFLMLAASGVFAQDEEPPAEEPAAAAVEEEAAPALTAEQVQQNLDWTWILIAGFLVFFMQAGFATLEGGFIRQTGVVNSLAENFMDACVTAVMFFIVGYGVAYGSTDNSLIFPGVTFALGGADGTATQDTTFIDFFFQFAFAGAAATIATGAMAERTDFRGKLIYSALLGAFIYPMVVFWTWGGGWIADQGFADFAGSGIVHMTGGVVALVGAIMVGPRVGRVFGAPPEPSNLGLATIGTFILWFGWYGFNVGSTLAANDLSALGLVAVNTTLAAAMGALGAMFYGYVFKGGKWSLPYILNGSLAGLVGITAGCAYVSPVGALIIGATAGVVLVLSLDAVEAAKVDDAVGAFAVHGACGALGALAVGFLGVEGLVGENYGLLMGGGAELLISQVVGVAGIVAWTTVTSVIVFGALKALGLLRMPAAANEIGIDAYEHGASVWPDVLPYDEKTAPAAGD